MNGNSNAVFLHLAEKLDAFVLLWPEQLLVSRDAWLRRIVEARSHAKTRLPLFCRPGENAWSRNGLYDGNELRKLSLARRMEKDGLPVPFHNALAACFFAGDMTGSEQQALPEVEAFEAWLPDGTRAPSSLIGKHMQYASLLYGAGTAAIRDLFLYSRAYGRTSPPRISAFPAKTPVGGADDHSKGAALLSRKKAVPLDAWQDVFSGKRCFIICNGPSLCRTNLPALKREYTFGLNRIYLNYAAMGFQPSFYVCVNPNIVRQFGHDLDQLHSVRFFEHNFAPYIRNHWKSYFLQHDPAGLAFHHDLRPLAWHQGWTVTYCAMQVAYFMGFQEVILVGCDHYFSVSGKPNMTVVSGSNDANHFHPDYFGKGVVWDHPDLENSERAYKLAHQAFTAKGRMIFDATIDGRLTVFPKLHIAALHARP